MPKLTPPHVFSLLEIHSFYLKIWLLKMFFMTLSSLHIGKSLFQSSSCCQDGFSIENQTFWNLDWIWEFVIFWCTLAKSQSHAMSFPIEHDFSKSWLGQRGIWRLTRPDDKLLENSISIGLKLTQQVFNWDDLGK